MRFAKELGWNLAEVVDESDGGVSLERVLYTEDVHLAFVEKRVEEVVDVQGRLARLFEAEDQVYPLRDVGRNVRALQRRSVDADDLTSTAAQG